MPTAKNCIPNPVSTRVVAGLPVRLTDSDHGVSFATAVTEFIASLQLDSEAIAKKIEKALSRGPIDRKKFIEESGATFDSIVINTVIFLMQRAGRVALIGPRVYAPQHSTGVLHSCGGAYLVDEFENTATIFDLFFEIYR